MSSEKLRFRKRKAPKRLLKDIQTTNPYYTEWYLEVIPETEKCSSCGEELIITQHCPCCKNANRLKTVKVSPSVPNLRDVLLNVILHKGELRKDTDEKEQLLRLMEFLETIEKAIHVFIERTYGYKVKRKKKG